MKSFSTFNSDIEFYRQFDFEGDIGTFKLLGLIEGKSNRVIFIHSYTTLGGKRKAMVKNNCFENEIVLRISSYFILVGYFFIYPQPNFVKKKMYTLNCIA